MMRNILGLWSRLFLPFVTDVTGHSVVQLIILLVLVFSADQWLDIPSGRIVNDGPTQHFTMVFNTFVLMQVCCCVLVHLCLSRIA